MHIEFYVKITEEVTNMSMFKRFIALALVLFMFLGLAPLSAFAATANNSVGEQ